MTYRCRAPTVRGCGKLSHTRGTEISIGNRRELCKRTAQSPTLQGLAGERRRALRSPPRLGVHRDGVARGRPVQAVPGRGRTPRVAVGRRRGTGAAVREDPVEHRRLRDDGDEAHHTVAARAREGIDCNDRLEQRRPLVHVPGTQSATTSSMRKLRGSHTSAIVSHPKFKTIQLAMGSNDRRYRSIQTFSSGSTNTSPCTVYEDEPVRTVLCKAALSPHRSVSRERTKTTRIRALSWTSDLRCILGY